nr:hypothetical protein [Tanacetum cinerariifolium]
MNGDELVQTTRDENGVKSEVPPKFAQAILARQRERKAKCILLLANPDEYQLRSSSNSQNVAFLSAKDTNSINEVNTTNGVSTAAGHSSSGQASSSSYINDLMFSFFARQSNSPQSDDDDLEQIDHDDLEEMNLKWQVECFNCHRRGHFAKECRAPRNQGNKNEDATYRNNDNNKRIVPVESSDALVIQDNALVVQDGLGYDWSYTAQEESTEFNLMAYTSGSDTETYKSVRSNLKGKEDLKAKLEQFEISSKNLNKLINSQLSAKDKTSLGYGDQLSESDSEVLPSVFYSRSSDGDDNPTNDKFKKDDGYHAVPPPLTGNYMPPLADLSFAGFDDYVYRSTANKASASISKYEPSVIKISNISVEMPKVDLVRTSGVIIKDWVSDDEDTLVDTQVDS